MKFKFIGRVQETSECHIFAFKPEDKFDFQPGQFLRWNLPHSDADERGVKRFFTISSSPTEGEVWIATRINAEKSSTFKKALLKLNPGDVLFAEGPKGDFVLPQPLVPMVFIAGGIGITPFRSMLKYLWDSKKTIDITLLYSNRTAEDIPFKSLIDAFDAGSVLKVVYTITDNIPPDWQGETGFIDAEMIKRYVPDYDKRLIYISGPEPMVQSFETMFAGMGLTGENIRTDYFPGYTETYSKLE